MTGLLASLDISVANTDTLLYTVPSTMTTVLSLCLVNRGGTNAGVRIALCTGSSVTNASYIAYNHAIYPNEVYERDGIVLSAGQTVYVRTDTTPVNAVVWGFEEVS